MRRGIDPHGAETGLDFFHADGFGHHLAKRGDVHLESRVGFGGRDGFFQLRADVPRKVLGGRHDTTGRGVVVDECAELFAGVGLVDAEQVGDHGEVCAAGAVQAQRKCILSGLGALRDVTRCHHTLCEERGGHGGAGLFIEALQRQRERRERVISHETDRLRHDPREDLFSGLSVDAAGGTFVETVDRAVGVVGARQSASSA